MGPVSAIYLLAFAACAPFSDPKADETIVFFPTYGRQVDGGKAWELHIHGWIFEIESRSKLIGPLYDILDLDDEGPSPIDDNKDDPYRKIFVERASPFFVDNQRGKRIQIRMAGETFTMPASGPDGHFRGSVRISDARLQRLKKTGNFIGETVSYQAIVPDGDDRVFSGVVRLIQPTGISIVCDIDDTVKITDVLEPGEMMRRTFLLPFEPIPGMPELLSKWADRPDVVFHFLSASPWQLYKPLQEFLCPPRFPDGLFQLRTFRMTGAHLLALADPPIGHKTSEIERLLEDFPGRNFVLVGDSGEKDPEIYSEICRNHPGRIKRIFIRDPKRGRTDLRYQSAFAGIPDNVAVVFREPATIADRLPGAAAPPTSQPSSQPTGP